MAGSFKPSLVQEFVVLNGENYTGMWLRVRAAGEGEGRRLAGHDGRTCEGARQDGQEGVTGRGGGHSRGDGKGEEIL